MALTFTFLDAITRKCMLDEFNHDIDSESCFLSKRFSDFGNKHYIAIMPDQILNGNDDSLSEELKKADCFKTHEERTTIKGISLVKVPVTASQTFSEGEFNRFYIRALCVRAIAENRELEIYRARHSENPRADSLSLIGQKVNPAKLLKDLRDNKGVDTSLGMPNGPNSGLSICFCI